MPANRLSIGVLAAVLAAGSTPALACVPLQLLSDDAIAERVRNHQAELWSRSDAVFLSQAGGFGPVDLGGMRGTSTTLSPSLALKGDLPITPMNVRHTTATTCGPIPMLDALTGSEGDWFVTYVRNLPSGPSVDATVPLAQLVDTDALRAWRKAFPVETAVAAD